MFISHPRSVILLFLLLVVRQCSFSTCLKSKEDSEKAVDDYAAEWRQKAVHRTAFPCYYHSSTLASAIVAKIYSTADVVHSMFWPSAVVVGCSLIFLRIEWKRRRLTLCGRKEASTGATTMTTTMLAGPHHRGPQIRLQRHDLAGDDEDAASTDGGDRRRRPRRNSHGIEPDDASYNLMMVMQPATTPTSQDGGQDSCGIGQDGRVGDDGGGGGGGGGERRSGSGTPSPNFVYLSLPSMIVSTAAVVDDSSSYGGGGGKCIVYGRNDVGGDKYRIYGSTDQHGSTRSMSVCL